VSRLLPLLPRLCECRQFLFFYELQESMLPSLNDLPRQSHRHHRRHYHTKDRLPSMTEPMKMTSIKFRSDDRTHMTLLAIEPVSVCQKQRFLDQEMVCLYMSDSSCMPSLQLPISEWSFDKHCILAH